MIKWSESDHPRADDGKFGSGGSVGSPKLHEQATSRAGKLASRASELPGRIWEKAKTHVKGKYDQLEKRYGKPTAIAIMAAGIAGSMAPIPGSTLIAAAPVIGCAELYLRLKGNPAKSQAEMTDEELAKLGKEFMEDLADGWTDK